MAKTIERSVNSLSSVRQCYRIVPLASGQKVRILMNYFLFYDQDVCIGEGYGLDPDDAIKRFCIKIGYGPEYADSLVPVWVSARSEWDVNVFNCSTI
jgi:hypothetical protein